MRNLSKVKLTSCLNTGVIMFLVQRGFLVNLAERKDNHLLVDRIDALRWLRLETVVVLPDHSLHCIWTLPPGCDGIFDVLAGE